MGVLDRSRAAFAEAQQLLQELDKRRALVAQVLRTGSAGPTTSSRSAGGYEVAIPGRRTDGWMRSSATANQLIQQAGPMLRASSRQQARDNPFAARALLTWTSNLVGEGMTPRPNTGDETLNKAVTALWSEWVDECDTQGQLGFGGIQSLVCRSWLESGEVLVRRWPRDLSEGKCVPLELQVLEADQLDQARSSGLQDGKRVIQGVELDASDRRLAYWLHRAHPEDSTYVRGRQSAVRVAASDLAHVYLPTRPTQVRGVPWLTPSLMTLRDVDDYRLAERVRKKIEACVVGIVTGGDDLVQPRAGQAPAGALAPGIVDAAGDIIEGMEPGMFGRLQGGTDVKFNAPATTGGYSEYVRTELRGIAAGVGLTYELLSGDLSQTNFTSLRAGLIEFRRLVRTMRKHVLVRQFLRRVWGWWIDAAVMAGRLPDRPYPVRWVATRFDTVDPWKEAQARLLMLGAGMTSYQDDQAEDGRDFRETLAEIAESLRLVDALGITLQWDQRSGGPVMDAGADDPAAADTTESGGPDVGSDDPPPAAAEDEDDAAG